MKDEAHLLRDSSFILPPSSLERLCVFCATFRRVAPPGRYPASCPVEPGLSSPGIHPERPPDPLRSAILAYWGMGSGDVERREDSRVFRDSGRPFPLSSHLPLSDLIL